VVAFGAADGRGAQDDKAKARIKVAVKGDGQQCPSDTSAVPISGRSLAPPEERLRSG
jgi:hypothetical protein